MVLLASILHVLKYLKKEVFNQFDVVCRLKNGILVRTKKVDKSVASIGSWKSSLFFKTKVLSLFSHVF